LVSGNQASNGAMILHSQLQFVLLLRSATDYICEYVSKLIITLT
jgi:hypothetical protein